MKIRLIGTQDETTHAVEFLRTALDLTEVSGFYPNRGDSRLGRVYLDTQPGAGQARPIGDNRCPSCEHRIRMHGPGGCEQEIADGPDDEPCCCPCGISRQGRRESR